MLSNASERIRTCPNASGNVRTGPKTSANLRKLRKPGENFVKTSRELREGRVRAVVVFPCSVINEECSSGKISSAPSTVSVGNGFPSSRPTEAHKLLPMANFVFAFSSRNHQSLGKISRPYLVDPVKLNVKLNELAKQILMLLPLLLLLYVLNT